MFIKTAVSISQPLPNTQGENIFFKKMHTHTHTHPHTHTHTHTHSHTIHTEIFSIVFITTKNKYLFYLNSAISEEYIYLLRISGL